MPQKRSIVLRPFLRSVPTTYLCEHALEVCKVVTSGEEVTAQELCVFGEQLLRGDTSDEAKRPILRNVWRQISKLPSIRGYVQCSVVWIEFAAKYFSLNELSVMLDCVIKKLLPDRKYEHFYDSLLSIVEKLMNDRLDIADLFATEQFPALIDLFRNDATCVKCATIVLSAFVRAHPMRYSSNFQFANQILGLCKLLHDSLNATSTDKDVKMASMLIERSLDRFDVDVDPERALDFFVDCRASLGNIDSTVAVSFFLFLFFSHVGCFYCNRTSQNALSFGLFSINYNQISLQASYRIQDFDRCKLAVSIHHLQSIIGHG
ncbi:unnamed protein product [Toxocara canis]|uniref:DUF3384 domain-containing protein n=1 Tax=Toxocara canis TaxID=6265 RepID=A0A183VHB4_TOXCA|nr:unnamed protein product [Toxocara canis]